MLGCVKMNFLSEGLRVKLLILVFVFSINCNIDNFVIEILGKYY